MAHLADMATKRPCGSRCIGISRPLFLSVLACLLPSSSGANETPSGALVPSPTGDTVPINITAAEVAEWFHYPGELVVTDLTASSRDNRRPIEAIWARRYTSTGHTFAPVNLGVYSPEALNDARLERLQHMRAKAPELEARLPEWKAQGLYIYQHVETGSFQGDIFLTGFGPGGAGYAVIGESPDCPYVIMISVHIPGDPPLERETEAPYVEWISDPIATGALQHVFEQFAAKLDATHPAVPAARP